MIKDLENEIWYNVPSMEGTYMISDKLRFKSLKRVTIRKNGIKLSVNERLLKLSTASGYLVLKDGVNYREFVHRIIATLFIANPHNKPCVNHKDGDKRNNSIENLEWCTYSENNKHAHKTGLKRAKSGHESPVARLIIDTQTGIFYDTIKEAANAKGISLSLLRNRLSGWNSNKCGLEYA